MNFYEIIAAVLIGNLLTSMVIWGAYNIHKYKNELDAPWIYYLAIGFPLVFALAVAVSIGGLPPQFDAIVAQ